MHFYKLFNEKVIPLVKANDNLFEAVDIEINQHGYIKSIPLTAHTVIWNIMSQGKFNKKKKCLFFPSDDKQNFDDMINISIYECVEKNDCLDNNDLHDLKEIRNFLKEKDEDYKTKEPGLTVRCFMT